MLLRFAWVRLFLAKEIIKTAQLVHQHLNWHYNGWLHLQGDDVNVAKSNGCTWSTG